MVITHDKATNKVSVESMDNQTPDCPDLLIKKGKALLLYNTSKPMDETNPIPFNSLDEYIYYLEAQRKLGNTCPILYLQEESNAQGEDVYRIRPSPFDQQGGLPAITDINKKNPFPPMSISDTTKTYTPPTPAITDMNNTTLSKMTPLNNKAIKTIDASREDPPYNAGQYAGFDPYGQYIGKYTDLDALHAGTSISNKISDNPMDPNWGGVEFTQKSIDTGKYEDNNVKKPLLYQPKLAFIPNDPNNPPPRDIL
jgi:hypothetical protein